MSPLDQLCVIYNQFILQLIVNVYDYPSVKGSPQVKPLLLTLREGTHFNIPKLISHSLLQIPIYVNTLIKGENCAFIMTLNNMIFSYFWQFKLKKLIQSRQPTSATYVACRECDQPPC